ncbi:MAG: aminotransferase class V-fold PLP-dependent enzyme [Spirochaetia bacterium]|jgi:cysteine desulfurase family protein|nr:aminotransferase class V-fold PLP-dependent enzyme [Spirochaetia bacterium]
MIYLDNAATSFPKPLSTAQAVYDFLVNTGANPGRSGHEMSISAARIVYETRDLINSFFNGPDPLRVVFTHNATYAINMALKGMLSPGSRVVTTSAEHNAVMRPIRSLEKKGIIVKTVPCRHDGTLDTADVEKALSQKTDLIVMSAASNVTGALMPVREIGNIARKRGIPFLVDTAQAGGAAELDMKSDYIDMLAFTGHKSLYGPPGTGGIIFGKNVDVSLIDPLIEGGTGSRSDSEYQPSVMPDRFESGTPNAAGLAGLKAGVEWITEKGRDNILQKERQLASILIDGLSRIRGVTVYGPSDIKKRTGVVSFTIEGIEVSDIGRILGDEYGIMTRVGLHCAPSAHKTIKTFPSGTVRISIGAFTDENEIVSAVSSVKKIAGRI